LALAGSGQVEEAIAHYQKALEIKPDFTEAHNNLGNALAGSGRFAEAIAHYRKALEIKRDYVDARRNLEVVLALQGTVLTALTERRELLRSRPKDVTLLNDTAWLLATAPNASARNGPEAMELAERACMLTSRRDIACLDTLAAAFAAAGRFDKAVETAMEARHLAEAAGQRPEAEAIQMRLELYRDRKPYREPVGKPSNR
jgi:spermidine synthase